jgi:hypothetical protein
VGSTRRLPFLVKWAVSQSHAIRYEDPEQMLLWADLARLFDEDCTPEAAGSRMRCSDLRARAWGQLGNALRVRSLRPEAKSALDNALRAVWQQGLLLRELNHLDAAEDALLQACAGFSRRHLPHETAIISLDLADLYLQQGAWRKMERVARIAMPLLRGLQLEKPTLALQIQLARAQARKE